MNSSPRPTRRFSRWQTKKRAFVLGGVTHNPAKTTTVKKMINTEDPKVILKRVEETDTDLPDIVTKTRFGTDSRKERREASEEGDSSNSSTTNKENKATTEGSSPAKRHRQDGNNTEISIEDPSQSDAEEFSASVSTNVSSSSSSKKNTEQINETLALGNSKERKSGPSSGQNQKILSEKRVNLRNRSLLTPAETLLRNRQYPVAFYPSKKVASPQEKASGDKQRTPPARKTPSPSESSHYAHFRAQAGLKSKKVTQKSSKKNEEKETSRHKNLQQSTNLKVQKPKEREGKENSSNVSQSNRTSELIEHTSKSSSMAVSTLEKVNQSHSLENNSSLSERYGLRDRSVLPTPEIIHQKRQYPMSFLQSAKKSDTSNSDISHTSENTSHKGKPNGSFKTGERNAVLSSQKKNSLKSSSALLNDASNVQKSSSRKREKSLSELVPEHSEGSVTVNQSVVKQSYKNNSSKIHKKKKEGINSSRSAVAGEEQISSNSAKSLHSSKTKQSEGQQSLRRNGPKISESDQSEAKKPAIATNNHEQFTNDNSDVNYSCSDLPNEIGNSRRSPLRDKEGKRANEMSLARVKQSDGKAKTKQYSLPRNQVAKQLFHDEKVTEKSFGDFSQRPSQSSIQIVDKSWKQISEAGVRKPAAQPEHRPKTGNKAPVNHRPCSTIDETIVVSQKTPRKRKLAEELEEVEEIDKQSKDGKKVGKKGEKRDIYLHCENGQPRKASDVTVYDIILQALTDTEHQLCEAVDNDLCERLVKKVMSKIKKSIKPMVPKVQGLKDLQHVIRKQKVKCKRLMEDLAKKQEEKTQFTNEKKSLCCKDINMMRINQWMINYTQLMATVNGNTTDSTN